MSLFSLFSLCIAENSNCFSELVHCSLLKLSLHTTNFTRSLSESFKISLFHHFTREIRSERDQSPNFHTILRGKIFSIKHPAQRLPTVFATGRERGKCPFWFSSAALCTHTRERENFHQHRRTFTTRITNL
jgi:hypothetical protein